jgi:Fe-S-cluster containining protein
VNAAVAAAGAAVYRRTAERLATSRDAATCETVGRELIDTIEAEFDALTADGAPIACAPSCTFCCHLRVGAYVHEAIALLRYLRTTAPRDQAAEIETRILGNARRIDGMSSLAEHYAARVRCAFLVDGRCAAYDVRPSACARYHSTSRARCEYLYDHPQDVGTPRMARPALAQLQDFGAAVDSATASALEHAGLSARKAELHQLLRALIEDPSVAERWQGGEGVAAGATPSLAP